MEENITEVNICDLKNLEAYADQTITFTGFVNQFEIITTKTGKPYGVVNFEDKTDNYTLYLFGKQLKGFHAILKKGIYLTVIAEVIEAFNRIVIKPITMSDDNDEIKLKNTDK